MPLSMVEYQVLSILPRGAGYPITTRNICKITQLSVRDVRTAVSNLIGLYGVPIVANRNNKNSGLFIATNDDELSIGIASFKSQVTAMNARISAIERADLNGWERQLRPDIERLSSEKRHIQGA